MIIGFVLTVAAVTALYQMRNGVLMAAWQRIVYAPPEEPAALAAAFAELGAFESETPGVALIDVARARLLCAELLAGRRADPVAAQGFVRLNLSLLGAGIRARSPVVAPVSHYIAETAPNLARDMTPASRNSDDAKRRAAMSEHLAVLTDAEHPLMNGLRLTLISSREALDDLTGALTSGGDALAACVAEAKFNAEG